ncbi:MAG: hypothetical protein P4L74_00475 [Candidatus Doudnabacteria bacterium]|nr:hypothetical protein [Candidatus Doudnabacteria bacterium]
MEISNQEAQSVSPQSIQWGHFGIIMFAVILLFGAAYLEKPQLFDFHKAQTLAEAGLPHYVPYVPSAEDLPQPAVLGASTDQGPQIIGDDGKVAPVNVGQVLGASTQGVQLSLSDIKVNSIPDSAGSVKQYFIDTQAIESNVISNNDFAGAINSGDQGQINIQAQKISGLLAALQKLPVPQSLIKLQQLKIVQYNSTIALLQNFTKADENPDQISADLQQFLKSQQDLDNENIAVAQKFPQDDPQSALYLNADGSPAVSQSTIDNFGSSAVTPSQVSSLTNLDNSDAGQ